MGGSDQNESTPCGLAAPLVGALVSEKHGWGFVRSMLEVQPRILDVLGVDDNGFMQSNGLTDTELWSAVAVGAGKAVQENGLSLDCARCVVCAALLDLHAKGELMAPGTNSQ